MTMSIYDSLYPSKSKARTILEDVQNAWLTTDWKITDEGLVVTFDIHMHRLNKDDNFYEEMLEDEYREGDEI